MIRCVIFDLDGTLIDTIEDLAIATNYALRKNGCKEHDVDAYFDFVGDGIKTLCERALYKQEIYDEKILENVFKDFKEYYDVHYNDFTCPYNGIIELLKYLKSKNIILGVFSNKVEHLAKKVIKINFGNDIFDFVLGESINYKRKPDASQLLDVLKNRNININECLYVGDSDVDMLTAKNAQIDAVAVTWGFRSRDILESYNPKYIVNSPKEIKNII